MNDRNGGTALVARQPGPAITQRGIAITSMDGLARFAQMVHKSGMAPKGMNVEAIGVAIQLGLEIGLSPMSAIQNIAIINGKPGIYGDAAKALVEQSGLLEDYEEYIEVGGKRVTDLPPNPPDTARAVVVCKRVGRKPATNAFSVAQAKRAGLWMKKGHNGQDTPWITYPERMLVWRARGFALRDNFPDVLKGIKTKEELEDYPTEPRRVPATVTSVEVPADPAPPVEHYQADPVPVEAEVVETPVATEPVKVEAVALPEDQLLAIIDGIENGIAEATSKKALEIVGRDMMKYAKDLGTETHGKLMKAYQAKFNAMGK